MSDLGNLISKVQDWKSKNQAEIDRAQGLAAAPVKKPNIPSKLKMLKSRLPKGPILKA